MSLTGVPFLVLLSIISIVLFGVVVWRMPRWVTKKWHVAARIGVVLGLILAILLTLAVAVNRTNLWYTNWDDLWGEHRVASRAQLGAAPQAAAGSFQELVFPVTQAAGDRPALPAPGERVQRYRYTGASSGLTANVAVVLPKNYDHSAPLGTYPVIMAVHGIPGSIGGWTVKMRVQEYVDSAVARGALRPGVVVVPEVEFPEGVDRECMDEEFLVETWLTDDMARFAVDRFGVIADRTGWVTMGYSAGGWCSAMLAMRNPQVYAAGASLDGYFRPDFAWKPDAPYVGGEYDMVHWARVKAPAVAVWVQAADSGSYWPQTEELMAQVREPTSLTTVVSATGGHRWDTWRRHMPELLDWVGQTVPGFRPV